MAATSVLIENLVTGVVGVVALFIGGLATGRSEDLLGFVQTVANVGFGQGALLLFVFLTFSYIVGLLINHVGYLFSGICFERKVLSEVFEGKSPGYKFMRAIVFQEGSDTVLTDLLYDRRAIRMSRNTSLIFLFLSIIVLYSRVSSLHFSSLLRSLSL